MVERSYFVNFIDNYIGVLKRKEMEGRNILDVIAKACENSHVKDLNIDMRHGINEVTLRKRGKEVVFVEIHVRNDIDTISKIIDEILLMEYPCYYGDVPVSVEGSSSCIVMNDAILCVPGMETREHLVRHYIDTQCNIYFPTPYFSMNDHRVKFIDLDIDIPITESKLNASLTNYVNIYCAGNMDSDDAYRFTKKHLENVTRATLIYKEMIWMDGDIPDSVKKVMDSVGVIDVNVFDHMKDDELKWLDIHNIKRKVNMSSYEGNFIDAIGDIIFRDDDLTREKAVSFILEHVNHSRFRNNNVELQRVLPNSLLISIKREQSRPKTGQVLVVDLDE